MFSEVELFDAVAVLPDNHELSVSTKRVKCRMELVESGLDVEGRVLRMVFRVEIVNTSDRWVDDITLVMSTIEG